MRCFSIGGWMVVAAASATLGLGRSDAQSGPDAEALVRQLTQARTARDRAHAAHLLGRQWPAAPATIKALCDALEDPERDVARDAANALGRLRAAPEVTLPALIKAASRFRWDTVQYKACLDSLGRFGAGAEVAAFLGAQLDRLPKDTNSGPFRPAVDELARAVERLGSAAEPIKESVQRRLEVLEQKNANTLERRLLAVSMAHLGDGGASLGRIPNLRGSGTDWEHLDLELFRDDAGTAIAGALVVQWDPREVVKSAFQRVRGEVWGPDRATDHLLNTYIRLGGQVPPLPVIKDKPRTAALDVCCVIRLPLAKENRGEVTIDKPFAVVHGGDRSEAGCGSSQGTRNLAFLTLATLGASAKSALPVLERYRKIRDHYTDLYCAAALVGTQGDAQAREVLRTALTGNDDKARKYALHAIGFTGDRELLPALEPFRRHADLNVRLQVAISRYRVLRTPAALAEVAAFHPKQLSGHHQAVEAAVLKVFAEAGRDALPYKEFVSSSTHPKTHSWKWTEEFATDLLVRLERWSAATR